MQGGRFDWKIAWGKWKQREACKLEQDGPLQAAANQGMENKASPNNLKEKNAELEELVVVLSDLVVQVANYVDYPAMERIPPGLP
jgi:hypothetical protein